ncbi:FAD-dependent oxidoreductase [Brevibacterium sp.]|uniref:FAD-dependent oxidoreductase n=1 Tax=Brevibacterium sp. TaxID=1701 RepID=UPI0028124047|nr:FAD-dependent oxidoreductase [Brevibacterium sp.]
MSEYIVVGAGLAGAATAWELTSRGENVTVLERSTPANDAGSSHGSARIFRYAYTDPLYTQLLVKAKRRWDELEETGGVQLITRTGSVDHGPVRDVAQLAPILDAAGVENELLSAADAQARWPQFAFDTEVLWHPDAGVLDAQTTVETMLRLAEGTGHARVLTDWTVAGIERRAIGGFTVRSTSGEVIGGDVVVVAAGGWLPSLLGDLALPTGFIESFPTLEVRQEQAFHLPYRDESGGVQAGQTGGGEFGVWPTSIHMTPETIVYSLPGGRDAGFRGQKIAEFNGGPVIDSALDQDGQIRPEMREKMVDYATRYLPGVVPEPYAETTCLFTNTSSEDFVIDVADGVVVVSACSGHGAKFAPLLGELAADLATGAGTVPDQFRVAAHRGR